MVDVNIEIAISSLFINLQPGFNFLNFANCAERPFLVTAPPARQAAGNHTPGDARAANPRPAALGGPHAIHGDLMMCLNVLRQQATRFGAAMHNSNARGKAKHPCVPADFQAKVSRQHGIRHTPHHHLCESDVTALTIQGQQTCCELDPNHQTNSFMTASGDHFVLQDLGPAAEKNFQTTATKHGRKTPCEFHKWCETVTVCVKHFNKCLHPCHCLRKGAQDPKGFADGNTLINVPSAFSTNITKDGKLIWDVLTSVFDTSTSKCLTVQVHDGRGHEALHQIIVKGHQ